MGRRPKEQRATREQIRALAHPIRFRMIELLREGPATASQLARRIGESSGSTSYHLRVLERADVVAEDASLGNGRDRWWRRVEPLLYISTEDDVEGRALNARFRSIFFGRDEEVRRRFAAAEPDLDPNWRRTAFVGAWYVDLTPEEADALGHRMMALIDEFRGRPEGEPADARRVLVSFSALPWID